MAYEHEVRMIDINMIDAHSSIIEPVEVVITDKFLWVNVSGICRIRIRGQFEVAPDGGCTKFFTLDDERKPKKSV